MSIIENPRERSLVDRLALVLRWVLKNSRPHFHYAALILFQAIVYGAVIQLVVLAANVFDVGYVVDYRLVGHFVGPLGFGALAAGQVRWRIADAKVWRGWLVAAVYGGTSMAVFVLLLGGAAWALVGFAAGAAVFMLIHWLQEFESRKLQRSDLGQPR